MLCLICAALLKLPASAVFQWKNSSTANTMSKIKITLVKSPIDKSKRQKDTLKALGFRKMNQTVERENNPQTLGMLRVVGHLVQVVEG